MRLEMPVSDIEALVARQLGTLFVFDPQHEGPLLKRAVAIALQRSECCFSETRVRSKYYVRDGEIYFNPFHSGQYAIFLYFLSNTIYREVSGSSTLSDRVYYLNKVLNGLDLFYEIEMPDAFFLDHPVGAVLGRAKYGEGFSFSQGCTVGNNKGIYPSIGRDVRMMSGSKIVGDCEIGDHVIIAANTYIKDANIPSCSIVFGSSPDLVIKQKSKSYFV
ncbi:MAG: hypothetical protein RQ867_02445 [Mariprofundaceae bacterium]|nr:hypothetical protein [Mariprofundaceae bacterium]